MRGPSVRGGTDRCRANLDRLSEQSESSQEFRGGERVPATDGIEQRNPRLPKVESNDVGRIHVHLLRNREEHGQRGQAFAALDSGKVRLGDTARPCNGFLRELRAVPELADARSDSSSKCSAPGPRRHGTTVPSRVQSLVAFTATKFPC